MLEFDLENFLKSQVVKDPYCKIKGSNAEVRCVNTRNHKNGDQNPSLLIFWNGKCFCRTCGGMNYNTIAREKGWDLIPKDKKDVEVRHVLENPYIHKRQYIPNKYPPERWRELDQDFYRAQFIDPITDWRGIRISTLKAAGVKQCRIPWSLDQKICDVLVFPMITNNFIHGFKKCRIDGVKPYASTAGCHGKGCLYAMPLALELDLFKTDGIMFITEGHRDALCMIQHQIPSVSILGVSSWCFEKQILLLRAKVKKLVILMDGDNAGDLCAQTIQRQTEQLLDTYTVYLPDDLDGAELTAAELQQIVGDVKKGDKHKLIY